MPKVSVDSGTIWVGDPCYLIGKLKTHEDWVEWCNQFHKDPENVPTFIEPLGEQMGVWLGSFGGDGTFHVEVKEGRWGVESITVHFQHDPDDEVVCDRCGRTDVAMGSTLCSHCEEEDEDQEEEDDEDR